MAEDRVDSSVRNEILNMVLNPKPKSKVKEMVEETLTDIREVIDIPQHLLIMAGHNPKNVKFVWYYDNDSKKVIGSFKAKSHDDNEFASIVNKENAVRGRVFETQGKTFLIIYGKIAGFRDASNEEIRSIYLQVTKEYPTNIDYVIDEEGNDLNNILESKTVLDISKMKTVTCDNSDPSRKSFNTLLEESLKIKARQDQDEDDEKSDIREQVIEKARMDILKGWKF